MKVLGIICLLAFMVLVQPIGADVYRYKDQHGNEIYTDDLNKVPAEQRAGAKVPDSANPDPANVAESKAPSTPDPMSVKSTEDLKKEQVQLEALKQRLRKEFRSLAEENARLKAEQKKAITPDQRKAYNKQVVSFNTRFQAYKEKEAAYRSRLEQYNKRLNAETSKSDNR